MAAPHPTATGAGRASRPASAGWYTSVPRIAPAPVSSGLSCRDLPAATLAQILRCCDHYEAKAEGISTDVSPAKRLLATFARDVRELVHVLKLRDDGILARNLELEARHADWTATFDRPDAALAKLGISPEAGTSSPTAVKGLLLELHGALTRRAGAVDATAAQHLALENASLRTALRDAVRVAREQAAAEIARVRAEADAAVSAERLARARAEEAAAATADAANRQAAEEVELRTAHFQRDKAAALAAVREEVAAATARGETARASLTRSLEGVQREAATAAAAAAATETALRKEVAALREALAAAQATAERDAHAAATSAVAAEARYRTTVQEMAERFERSTERRRVMALEDQIAFLQLRVNELQDLVATLQAALHAHTAVTSGGRGLGAYAALAGLAASSASAGGTASAPSSSASFSALSPTWTGGRARGGVMAAVHHAGLHPHARAGDVVPTTQFVGAGVSHAAVSAVLAR